jgi:hypothetical protein
VTYKLGNTVTTIARGRNNTANGLANGVGSKVDGVTGGLSNTTSVNSGRSNTVPGVGGGLSKSLSGLPSGAVNGSGSTHATGPTTTTPTAPRVVGGLGDVDRGNSAHLATRVGDPPGSSGVATLAAISSAGDQPVGPD